jgi:proliferating cell nuclear antigen
MDIDADRLGIPETDYDARVTMSAGEFTRIVRDLTSLGESVRIEVSKEGIRFTSEGEAAQGNILLKQTDAAREQYENYGNDDEDDVDEVKAEDDDDVVEVKAEDDEVKEEDDEKPKKVKKEEVKKEGGVEDEDEEMASGNDEAEFKAKSEDEEDEPSDNEKKKRKRPAKSSSVRSLLFVPCERLVTNCTGLESEEEGKEGSRWLGRR